MGRFIKSLGHKPLSPSIVLLQWENSPAAASPRLRFWIIPCPSRHATPPSPPDATLLPQDRVEMATCISFGANARTGQLQLPPLVKYDKQSQAILMQNLVAGEDGTDVECLRWGPGLRLTEMHITERFFSETGVSLGAEPRFLATPAVIESGGARQYDDVDSSRPFLLATTNGETDDLNIKYRATDVHNVWNPLVSEQDVDSKSKPLPQQQIVRVLSTAATAKAAVHLPVHGSSAPVHTVKIGSSMRYNVIITLGRSQDSSQTGTQVSLYTTEAWSVFNEAISVKKHEQDLGLRWQLQNLTLPDGVTNISPLVVKCSENRTYLVLFYSHQSALHYEQIEYAGSGSFHVPAKRVTCLLAPNIEEQASKPAKKASTGLSVRSRWSLNPTLYSAPQEPPPEQPKDQSVKRTIPTATQWCQPGVIEANGFLWVFYRGEDGRGRYVYQNSPVEITDLESGWQESSWTAEPLLGGDAEGDDKASPVSRHLIPVVVPGDYMAVY